MPHTSETPTTPRCLHLVRCPECRCHLETDLGLGELIQCPNCDEVFRVGRGNIVPTGGAKEVFARIAIPIGYVLFVALPSAGIIYWLATRNDRKAEDSVPAAAEVAVRPPALPTPADAGRRAEDFASLEAEQRRREAEERRRDAARRAADLRAGEAEAAALAAFGKKPGTPAEVEPPKPRREGAVRPPEAEPPALPAVAPPRPKLALLPAPPPHAAPFIQEAPEPREILWRLPTSVWQSKWQTLGAVDLRVTNVAVTHYPLLTAKGVVEQSKAPALAVVVEAKLKDPKRERSLLGWTYGLARYGDAFLPDGRQLPARTFPPGAKVNHGLAFPVELPRDGTPVRDVLLFDLPPAGTREIEVRLDGDRVREPGNMVFTLPAESWQRKAP